MLISVLKFLRKIPKLPRRNRMSIKDVQKWVMLRPKLDVSGYGDQIFRLLRTSWMKDFLSNSFLLLNIFFSFVFISSLSALLLLFSLFCILSKRDNHNLKKTRSNLKINPKMHHQFHSDKKSTKEIKYDKGEL